MQKINKNIKALRKRKGLTLEAVSLAVGMSPGNLSRLERGEIGVSNDRIIEFAKFFGISVEELMNVKPSKEDEFLESITSKEAQILRMQLATEEFLISELQYYFHANSDDRKLSPEERMKNATELLFARHNIALLLNGENTRPDFSLLPIFREYQIRKSQETQEDIREVMRTVYKL